MFLLTGLLASLPFVLASPSTIDSPSPGGPSYDDTVDPYVVRSPSGAYTLEIDPTRPRGDRPCRVTLRSSGAERWSADFACVWRDAIVTDDGTSVAHGLATTKVAAGAPAPARLHAWIVGPDGARRLEKTWECEPIEVFRSTSHPRIAGTLLDASRNRWLARLATRDERGAIFEWHWFDVASGAALDVAKFDELGRDAKPPLRELRDLVPIAGTPWLLARRTTWRESEPVLVEVDAFELLDDRGHAWWTLELDAPDRFSKLPPLVRCDGPRRFDLASSADTRVRRFELVADAKVEHGFVVRELESTTREAVADPADPVFESASVEIVSRAMLDDAAPPKPWRDASSGAIALDDRGRVGALIEEADERVTFVLAERNGAELARIPLPEGAQGFDAKLAWIRDERWMATANLEEDETEWRHAWWIDVRERRVTPVESLAKLDVVEFGRTPDGGVAFTHIGEEHAIGRLDPDGALLWTRTLSEELSFFAAALAVGARSRIALLSSSMDATLLVLDERGELAERIALVHAFSVASTTTFESIVASPDGGWLVEARHGELRTLRLNAHGVAERVDFTPKRLDGTPLPSMSGLPLQAPDGALWWRSGDALVPLDASGYVSDEDALDGRVLREIAASTFDTNGVFHVIDRSTRVVHAFDDRGARVLQLTAPASFTANMDPCWITVSPSKRVFVGNDSRVSPAWREFTAAPTAADDAVRLPARASEPRFAARIEAPWSCAVDDDHCVSIARSAPDGADVIRIERRPNGAWLSGISEHEALSDGGVAIADDAGLHVYRADGRSRATIEARVWCEAMEAGSNRLAIVGMGELFVIDLSERGARTRRIALPFEADLDGARAAPLDDGTVRLFLAASRELVTLRVRD